MTHIRQKSKIFATFSQREKAWRTSNARPYKKGEMAGYKFLIVHCQLSIETR